MQIAWARLKELAREQAAIGANPTASEAQAVVIGVLRERGQILALRVPAEAVEFFVNEYLALVGYYKTHPQPPSS